MNALKIPQCLRNELGPFKRVRGINKSRIIAARELRRNRVLKTRDCEEAQNETAKNYIVPNDHIRIHVYKTWMLCTNSEHMILWWML